jgi:hypothetical protein
MSFLRVDGLSNSYGEINAIQNVDSVNEENKRSCPLIPIVYFSSPIGSLTLQPRCN